MTLQNRFKGDSDEIDEDNRKLGMVHESVIWYNKATMSGNQRLVVMSENISDSTNASSPSSDESLFESLDSSGESDESA